MPYITTPDRDKIKPTTDEVGFMGTKYKVEVNLTKNPFERATPYEWRILSDEGGIWHIVGSNKCDNINSAFKQSVEYYNKFLKEK